MFIYLFIYWPIYMAKKAAQMFICVTCSNVTTGCFFLSLSEDVMGSLLQP